MAPRSDTARQRRSRDGYSIRFRSTLGFDQPSPFEPDRVEGTDLLAFAGIPLVLMAVLPLEIHVAEKLHAYTRRYADGRQASTRVKDLVDLALIASEVRLDATRLEAAIVETFGRRAAQAVPVLVPPPPAEWRLPYRVMATGIGLEPDLNNGHRLAGRFLDPLLQGEVRSGSWDPSTRRWQE